MRKQEQNIYFLTSYISVSFKPSKTRKCVKSINLLKSN